MFLHWYTLDLPCSCVRENVQYSCLRCPRLQKSHLLSGRTYLSASRATPYLRKSPLCANPLQPAHGVSCSGIRRIFVFLTSVQTSVYDVPEQDGRLYDERNGSRHPVLPGIAQPDRPALRHPDPPVVCPCCAFLKLIYTIIRIIHTNHVLGNALHEICSQKTSKRLNLVTSQERSALLVLWMNRLSRVRFRCSVGLTRVSFCRVAEESCEALVLGAPRTRGTIVAWANRSVGVLSCSAPPCPTAPPCAAPLRPANDKSGFWTRHITITNVNFFWPTTILLICNVCLFYFRLFWFG